MAHDDMPVIMYKILAYLYDCMKLNEGRVSGGCSTRRITKPKKKNV